MSWWSRRRRPPARRHLAVGLGGARVVIAVDDDEAAWFLARCLAAPVAAPAEPDLVLTIDPDVRPRAVRVSEADPRQPGARPPASYAGRGELLVDVSERVERWWPHRLEVPLLHAGAVAHEGGGVVVAGASRAGKSTLVVELVEAGAAYASDELVALLPGGEVEGYGRPAQLRDPAPVGGAPAGWWLVPSPQGALAVAHRRRPWLRPTLVVVPHRVPGPTAPTLRPLTAAATARALLANSFNLTSLGWPGIEAVVGLAALARGVEATYHEAAEVAPLLLQHAVPPPVAPAGAEGPLTIPGRRGRAWRLPGSVLVVAGDRRRVLSLDGDVDLPSARPELDAALGGDGW